MQNDDTMIYAKTGFRSSLYSSLIWSNLLSEGLSDY